MFQLFCVLLTAPTEDVKSAKVRKQLINNSGLFFLSSFSVNQCVISFAWHLWLLKSILQCKILYLSIFNSLEHFHGLISVINNIK